MRAYLKILSLMLLCSSMLFSSENVNAQCNFNINIQEIDSCGYNDIELHTNLYGPTYNYVWSNGDSSNHIYNQTTGTYTVTVTYIDSNNTLCIDSATITVTDDTCGPCAFFSAVIDEVPDGCPANDVTVYTLGYGGSGIYNYLWNTGETNDTIYNKTTGTYTVTITDSVHGCSDTLSISAVDDTCSPCQNFNVQIYEADSCLSNDIMLYTNYWNGRYTHAWSTGESSNSIVNKPAGTYSVVVTDSINNCIDSATITVTDDTCSPCQNFYAYIQVNDGNSTNDLTLTAFTGNQNSGLTYSWSNGATTQSITGQTTGSFWVAVEDTINGCIDTAYGYYYDSTHDPCQNFNVKLYSNDNCKQSDVVIYSNRNGSSYQYAWSNGDSSRTLSGMPSGTYSVTITSSDNCVDSATISVTDSVYKCCRAAFSHSGSGATKSFVGYGFQNTTYNWNYGDGTIGTGSQTSHTYTSMGNKTVCLYIEDSVGCKDTACKTVIAPPPGKNLNVTHYGQPYIIDTTRYIYVFYSNIGTTTETATVEYYMPDSVTYSSSTVTPTTNSGNKLTFNVGSLIPGQSGFVKIYMTTPSTFTLGSMRYDTSKILTLTGDIDVSNNTSIVCDSVVGSYDPNDKTPYPKGVGENGNIDPETSEISYLIRFQNEGNWRTYKVRVEDEIDPSFDIKSLMIGDYSHDARLVVNGNKLVWYFDDIHLTPKSEDEEKSQGYIQYTLKLKENLPLGTQIKNTAYIYFDKNPPIITNTTVNTLKSEESTASIDDMRTGNFDFNILNKDNEINIVSEKYMERLSIYDMNGRLIFEDTCKTREFNLDKSTLGKNIYIFQVKIDDKIVVKKFQL